MKRDKYFQLSPDVVAMAKKLQGPILIFGGGGFVGINLLQSLLLYRKDVYTTSHNIKKNWRFPLAKVPSSHIFEVPIENTVHVEKLIKKVQPRTIFNLAAYGGYAKQTDTRKIFETNFIGVENILRTVSNKTLSAYIQLGSSSEYGENAQAPHEESELNPNSDYAVSKVASYYAVKYFGKVLHIPAMHVRLYSAYGPFEEPDRLIPLLVKQGRKKIYPSFVHPEISRDFIYITDVTVVLITIANKMGKKYFGEVFNVGTGKKTTISELAYLAKKIFKMHSEPKFETMQNRNWDHLKNWYANIDKIKRDIGWIPKVGLPDGIHSVNEWQKSVHYDSLFKVK